jgi:hypothetical protein
MDVEPIKKEVEEIFKRRQAAILAMCKYEAASALQEFQVNQPASPDTPGKYWFNRTAQAAARVFADGELTEDGARWFMAHGVLYGVYLELSNNRAHEALRPIIEARLKEFMWKIGELYKDV